MTLAAVPVSPAGAATVLHRPLRLSVVVPAYNEEPYLEDCLRSLRAQHEQDFELIVVDNNSVDATAAIAARYADRVLSEPRQGYHHAARHGLAQASGNIVTVCDADTRYPPDWVETIYAEFREHDSGIYGAVDFHDGPWLYRTLVRIFCFTVFMRMMRLAGIDVCNGFNFVFSKTAYDAVGGYDPALYDKVGLDIHLGRRLVQRAPLRFVPRLRARTSMRRIADHGLWHFVTVNLAMYWAFLRGGETRTSYAEYNDPPTRRGRRR